MTAPTRARMICLGPWQVPWKVTKALCSDGVRRTAWITADAATFFSIPARVKVKGKTVSGFVTSVPGGYESEDDYAFTAYEYGKNGRLLPGLV